MGEAAAALLAAGQQVLQQQGGGSQTEPTVCFAMVPLLVPAALIAANALRRRVRREGRQPA
ncbi:MAG: hypothetical protein IT305_08880 [Chloroflexi bacterium]|nr:hypothetical protein [Chloroflexota bacterium]